MLVPLESAELVMKLITYTSSCYSFDRITQYPFAMRRGIMCPSTWGISCSLMEKWPSSLSGTVYEPTELMLESTTVSTLCEWSTVSASNLFFVFMLVLTSM